MHITTVTRKGQVTIPASVRQKLGIKTGQKVIFTTRKGSAELKPALDFFSFRGALKGKPYDKKKIRKAIGEHLGRRHAKFSAK